MENQNDKGEVLTLDPVIKAKWIDALRSGKYEQGRGSLKSNTGYCCLGILALVLGENVDNMADELFLEGHFDLLDKETQSTLANKNDGCNCERKHTFEEIAAHIEANL